MPECETGGYVSVDVEGGTVAAALSYTHCAGRDGTEVWVREGEAQPRMVYRGDRLAAIRQVRLAGGLIGWTEDTSAGVQRTLVVRELGSGRERMRIGARRFIGRRTGFDGFDLAEDGTVVAAGSGLNRRCDSGCVVWLRTGDRRRRVLSRRAWAGQVAISGRHLAFATETRLLVTTLGGKRIATLDRFHRRRTPIGELVLDGRRAAWGVIYSENRDGQLLTARF